MSDRKTREVQYTSGDGTVITYVCWEDNDGSRGFYEKKEDQ